VYVDPNQPLEFVKAITPFLNDKALLSSYQDAGRKLAEKKYSRNELGEKFSRIIGEEIEHKAK
jgi:hypothetical protein